MTFHGVLNIFCRSSCRWAAWLWVVGLSFGVTSGARAGEGQHDSGDNTGLGYLTAPSMAPGHILRPSSLFVLPVSGPEGTTWLDVDFHWANIWDYKQDHFMIDGEWIRSNVRVTHAIDDATATGVAIPVLGRTGGFADPLIEDFHKTFHLGNAYREDFPQNRSSICVSKGGVNHTIAKGDSWGVGDVSAFVARRLSEGTSTLPAIAVQGQVSLPTGDTVELRGMGASSVALAGIASKRLGGSPFIAFGGVGAQYCPEDVEAGLELHKVEWSGLGGIAYQYSDSLSLIAQYLGSSPVAKDADAFSKPCHEVSGGIKWRVTDQATLEFAIVENVAIFNNSADISAHLCLGTKL